MSNYTIEISYTANKNKAAKIKVKDSSNKIILKSDAIISNYLHERENLSYDLALHKFISTEYSPSNCYADVNKISEFHQLFGSDYIGDKDSISSSRFIPKDDFYSEKKLIGVNDEITLSTDMFNSLKSIISDKNNRLTVEFNQKWYIFGQKSCTRNLNSNFNAYMSLSEHIEAEEKIIKHKEKMENDERENNKFGNKLLKFASNVAAVLQDNNNSNAQSQKSHSKKISTSSNSSKSRKKGNSDFNGFDNFLKISQTITIASDDDSKNYGSSHNSFN
jgi:hypothetical protein